MDDLIGKGAVGEFADIENIFQVDLLPGFFRQQVTVHGQHLGYAAANNTETQNCYMDHLCIPPLYRLAAS